LTNAVARPGWGSRHPDIADLLRTGQAVATEETAWGVGRQRQIRRAAYVGEFALPEELITSVRCIVQVGDELVVCTNVDGASHPWPGGRREPGETLAETARREVHEETGWLIDIASLRRLGWVHIENLEEMDPELPYPYPDLLQVVFACRADERDGDESWTDTEGYEAESCLMSLDAAHAAVDGDPLSRVFLDLLRTETHERL
jgi:ADP-ribose pyrophosphatase YjhB (NUDIX family)